MCQRRFNKSTTTPFQEYNIDTNCKPFFRSTTFYLNMAPLVPSIPGISNNDLTDGAKIQQPPRIQETKASKRFKQKFIANISSSRRRRISNSNWGPLRSSGPDVRDWSATRRSSPEIRNGMKPSNRWRVFSTTPTPWSEARRPGHWDRSEAQRAWTHCGNGGRSRTWRMSNTRLMRRSQPHQPGAKHDE